MSRRNPQKKQAALYLPKFWPNNFVVNAQHYVPARHPRKATWDEREAPEGRWRSCGHGELTARDKTSLDVFWLKDKNLIDLDNLPKPEELAERIIGTLEAGLESFRGVLAALR